MLFIKWSSMLFTVMGLSTEQYTSGRRDYLGTSYTTSNQTTNERIIPYNCDILKVHTHAYIDYIRFGIVTGALITMSQ